ncbi:ATP-binding protein [Polaribacter sp. AHE13PA]|jgi:hypothetical protein|uniref:ATP-binding protein n=1 Tax=Polaribacter sp. AHE13PA TaxID=2745562 RepID=UPI001C4F174D|nr:ATP-binding protein [Polaribacter sp. AHE13PA]QXP65716.1 putative DNA binding domain-containing protein [Polaribacter sp. AHE13PA]
MTEKLNLVSTETIQKIKLLDVKSECTDLDYKEIFTVKEKKAKIEIAKDISSFANTKGGYIIYGVNNSFDWIGLDERSDENVDDAIIANIIDEYIDAPIEFVSNIIEIEDASFFIIYIMPYEGIIPFKRDGQYNKKAWKKNSKATNVCVFKKGDVYCRRNSRSIKADNLFFKLKENKFSVIENISSQSQLYNEFIGRNEYLDELSNKLNNDNNRIIQIDGIGGIGKTTFVHYFTSLLSKNEKYSSNFEFIVWTSSKRNKYTPHGIKLINDFVSNYADLINDIYKFIDNNGLINDESIDEEDSVIEFLTNNRVLLVVDNLETLKDSDLISFLENFPKKSKAILTTRETLADFFMARINLTGFKKEIEFPNFLNSQFKLFSGKTDSFTSLYGESIDELYNYTKGMPLAGQLITHQLSQGTPITIVLENLKSGEAYKDILSFCFKGSIDKLPLIEQTLLFIFSLSEKEELLTLEDLMYISGFSADEIGMDAIPRLIKISLCYFQNNEKDEIGYSIPHLAKIYTKQYSTLENEKTVLEKYETFVQEKKSFNESELNSLHLFYRSKANNHKEKVIANKAIKALTISNYDYDSGIEIINELIKENIRYSFLYLVKGKIEENGFYEDSYTRSKKEFLTAIELDTEFLEALIELGFLEFKNRLGNKKDLGNIIKTSIEYFERAYKLDPVNQRTNLGLAQTYTAQAKRISRFHNKEGKIAKADLANNHFDKAFYVGENLTKTQKHSNAITAFIQASNYKTNLKDFPNALSCCEKGLNYEPNNTKLAQLKSDIKFILEPNKFTEEKFKDKGWKITSA